MWISVGGSAAATDLITACNNDFFGMITFPGHQISVLMCVHSEHQL